MVSFIGMFIKRLFFIIFNFTPASAVFNVVFVLLGWYNYLDRLELLWELIIIKYIEYDQSLHGKLTYPDGFYNLLEGLSLEEQLEFFRIGNGVYLNEDFSKRRNTECHYSNTIKNEDRVKEIIVCDNMIAGVMVKNCYGKLVPCLPERGFIIRNDSEIDGS